MRLIVDMRSDYRQDLRDDKSIPFAGLFPPNENHFFLTENKFYLTEIQFPLTENQFPFTEKQFPLTDNRFPLTAMKFIFMSVNSQFKREWHLFIITANCKQEDLFNPIYASTC